MILVTGATGTVGREVVRRLPADLRVRIMARDPAKVTGASSTAETVAGDYEDPRSLARAVTGVRTAFLVTTRVTGDDDSRFVRAAQRAGVQRLVKLSAAAVLDQQADDLITRWQRANEELLRASGMEWTLLRPRAFMSNSLAWAASIRSERTVRALYGTSVNACVDPRDIAEVAVRALTEERHAGCTYTLTGPEALTAIGQTEQLGRLLGVPLDFEELSRDEACAALRRRYPAPVVEALLESAERQRAGAKAQVEDTVRTVTGRSAGSFRGWAEDHLEAFALQEPGTPVPSRSVQHARSSQPRRTDRSGGT
ncbi:NAD(P)H-binding protein [Streptomyces sp. NBC_00873]|uniref:NAD(P)H-binding protein n=1 Tax=unclassified Streptomyces TaxID=2593676 RepID=UPI003866137D|nr:NAD(P)H-binding protein [Streptomyces sp. NBC_00873]WSY96679.1 NAD(P)H-binding protein [Streptomyces sp. NBC_00873]WTA41547.1 NAD(P)H-binding protein [Streptomyces sp. NBC_00842]WTA48349.1 NAD(P)H-binding protein [Streptomyces sp. NBC_00842]